MGFIKKEMLIGFAVAIFAALIGFTLYAYFISPYEIEETINVISEGNLWGKVLGLSAIPNLFVFFIYLKKKQDYRARGVMLACFLITLLILFSMFL